MAGVIDIKQFEVTPQIAAHAVRYLLDSRRSSAEIIVENGVTRYVGWGGREVVCCYYFGRPPEYNLRSFRRFEYRILENMRSKIVDVDDVFDHFWLQADLNKKEKQDGLHET